MKLRLRELIIVCALVAACVLVGRPDATTHLSGTENVAQLGTAPPTLAPNSSHPGLPWKIGVHFNSFDPYGFDFWDWNVELVVYRDFTYELEGRPLTDEELDENNIHLPWRYRFPCALVLLVCLVELFLVARHPRSARFAVIAGGIAGAIAIVFAVLGLEWTAALPALIAVHHFSLAFTARANGDAEGVVTAPRPRAPKMPRTVGAKLDDDPFRSPPQAPPIAVRRPSTAPADVPVEHDENAAKPTLLT
ncbi:MAG TPA: hypothetical protein VGM90_11355 [Kofleriaceae bacterium]|jgi:hypothetical protein